MTIIRWVIYKKKKNLKNKKYNFTKEISEKFDAISMLNIFLIT